MGFWVGSRSKEVQGGLGFGVNFFLPHQRLLFAFSFGYVVGWVWGRLWARVGQVLGGVLGQVLGSVWARFWVRLKIGLGENSIVFR